VLLAGKDFVPSVRGKLAAQYLSVSSCQTERLHWVKLGKYEGALAKI
jgi:hypothetical protein